MEKEKIKNIVEKTIEISKEENISPQKVEYIIISILERKNNGKLEESDKKYIKELLHQEYKGNEKFKFEVSDELKDLDFFKPISPTTDTTSMDLVNTAFEIGDIGLGTFINKKLNKKGLDTKILSPLTKELNNISNSFVGIFKDSFKNVSTESKKEIVKLNEEIEKITPNKDINLKSITNSYVKEIVKANSKNIKKDDKLTSNEEKFVKNMNKIVDKLY